MPWHGNRIFGEQISMEPEDVQIATRWYQRPVAAVAAGIALAAGITFMVIAYVVQAYGEPGAFAMLVLSPAMPGFVVGLIAGRAGDKWAAVSAGLFAVGMAAYITTTNRYEDDLTIFMMGVGLGVPAVALAAVFGKLGEMSAELAPKVRNAVALLVVLALVGLPAGYWLNVRWEMFQFRRSVLPSIQARFSEHVMTLPPDTKWTMDWTRFPIGGRHIIGASTTVKGHALSVRASSSGDRVYRCRCAYEPPKPVRIAGQKAIRDYLKGFGTSDEIIARLRYYDEGGVLARSWFCPGVLVPHPSAKPCTLTPQCGSDQSFALLSDGAIRLGSWYYRP